MLNRFVSRIQALATLRNVLIALAIFVATSIVIFNFGLVPTLIERADGAPLLDNRFGYTAAQVEELFEAYGEAGRSQYRTYLLLLDFAYAVVFAIANALLIAGLTRYLFPRVQALGWVALLPLVAMLLDFIENVGLLSLLGSYPDLSSGGVTFANAMTSVKLVLVNGLFFVTLLGIVGSLVKFLIRRFRRA